MQFWTIVTCHIIFTWFINKIKQGNFYMFYLVSMINIMLYYRNPSFIRIIICLNKIDKHIIFLFFSLKLIDFSM